MLTVYTEKVESRNATSLSFMATQTLRSARNVAVITFVTTAFATPKSVKTTEQAACVK